MTKREQEDATASAAMQALAEAKNAEALPADIIQDLEEAVASIYAVIVVDRAMEGDDGQQP